MPNALIIGAIIQIVYGVAIPLISMRYGLDILHLPRDPLVVYTLAFCCVVLLRATLMLFMSFLFQDNWYAFCWCDLIVSFMYFSSGWFPRLYYGWQLHTFLEGILPLWRRRLAWWPILIVMVPLVSYAVSDLFHIKYGNAFPAQTKFDSWFNPELYKISIGTILLALFLVSSSDVNQLLLFKSVTKNMRNDSVRNRTIALVLISFIMTLSIQVILGIASILNAPTTYVAAIGDIFVIMGPLIPLFVKKHPSWEQKLLNAIFAVIHGIHNLHSSGVDIKSQRTDLKLASTLVGPLDTRHTAQQ